MQVHCSRTPKPFAGTASAMLLALAIFGLIFPASVFAQPSLAAPDTSARTLKIDQQSFGEIDGPPLFRVQVPNSDREFLFLKADDGYFFSDANDPSIFGFFNEKDFEGEAEMTFQPGAGSAHGYVPTRDAEGNMVKTGFRVVEEADGRLNVTFDTGDFQSGFKDGAPHFIIDSPALGLSPDLAKGIVVTIVILIVVLGGCAALLAACRNACIGACEDIGATYLNVRTTLCGLLQCTCECEERVPEVNPACI